MKMHCSQSFQNEPATVGAPPATSRFIAGYFFLMRYKKSNNLPILSNDAAFTSMFAIKYILLNPWNQIFSFHCSD